MKIQMTLTYSKLLATFVFVVGSLLSYLLKDNIYFTATMVVVGAVVAGQNAGKAYVESKKCDQR
jgi:hypothetical protein